MSIELDLSDLDDDDLRITRQALAHQYRAASEEAAPGRPLSIIGRFAHASIRAINDELEHRAGILDELDPDLDGIGAIVEEPERSSGGDAA